jgi:glutathione synthase/RimK-type ligase-like ATP-grasp enzyme
MTELNVTSPIGIRELERISEGRIADQIIDAVASRLR